MLHHYNYTSPLSHFLSYHQLQEDSASNENGSMTPLCDEIGQRILDPRFKSMSGPGSNKSFTIAAILGLQTDREGVATDMQTSPTDLSAVVNLSVHHHHQAAAMANADRSAAVTGANLVSSCSRLQLPARGPGASGGVVTGHGFPGSGGGGGGPTRTGAKGLKHLAGGSINNNTKKNCKSKRVRTIFTPDQLERLEAEFERQQYMVGPERLYLAHTLQLTEAQVKVWFQNRRIKWRKHHLEMTQQRLAALKQQQILLGDVHQDTQDTNSSGTDT